MKKNKDIEPTRQGMNSKLFSHKERPSTRIFLVKNLIPIFLICVFSYYSYEEINFFLNGVEKKAVVLDKEDYVQEFRIFKIIPIYHREKAKLLCRIDDSSYLSEPEAYLTKINVGDTVIAISSPAVSNKVKIVGRWFETYETLLFYMAIVFGSFFLFKKKKDKD